MRITADTSVLVRALTEDDPLQAKVAQAELLGAELVALPLVPLCELAWVLQRGYRIDRPESAEAIRRLTWGANVAVNRPAVESGLAILEAGGDFADGIIADEGAWLGASASFDRAATALIEARGGPVRPLS